MKYLIPALALLASSLPLLAATPPLDTSRSVTVGKVILSPAMHGSKVVLYGVRGDYTEGFRAETAGRSFWVDVDQVKRQRAALKAGDFFAAIVLMLETKEPDRYYSAQVRTSCDDTLAWNLTAQLYQVKDGAIPNLARAPELPIEKVLDIQQGEEELGFTPPQKLKPGSSLERSIYELLCS